MEPGANLQPLAETLALLIRYLCTCTDVNALSLDDQGDFFFLATVVQSYSVGDGLAPLDRDLEGLDEEERPTGSLLGEGETLDAIIYIWVELQCTYTRVIKLSNTDLFPQHR